MRPVVKSIADRVTRAPSIMLCIRCGRPTVAVLDSRMSGNDMKRRRGCLSCNHRWTTYEISADRLRILESGRSMGERAAEETA